MSEGAQQPRSVLSVAGLTKRFGAVTVLEEVSFAVPRGSVIGLVGENGAGKSTLLNILSGMLRQDAGEMFLGGRPYRPASYGAAAMLGVSRVFQEQALVLNVPVYENLVLGQERRFSRAGVWVDRRAMIVAAERMVAEAGVAVDVRRPTREYDFSRRQIIEVVRACLAPLHLYEIAHPVVLLDEPTSALDKNDERAFFRLVERVKVHGSVVFVSHRLSEVLALSDLVHVLKDGRLVATLDPGEADENKLHGLMVGRERASDYYHESRQRRTNTAASALLEVRGLSQSGRYEGVSLDVHAGEVVGIGGLLDSGKSALGKGIVGLEPPVNGTVRLNGDKARKPEIRRLIRAGIGYIPAERLTEALISPFRVSWNVSMASGHDLFSSRSGWWRARKEETVAGEYINKLSIRSATPRTRCHVLSGGNQQKVVLARWLCREPKLLVLDNPTRGMDAGAKEEIYRWIRALTERGMGILLITDELLELIGLSNRIFIMQSGRTVAELEAPPGAKPSEHDLVARMLPANAQAGKAQRDANPPASDPSR
ncbi:MAG: sugar ABC transporter ATP-binding protein [Verrucomicrobia bacterium]|nr:sugar ABC transporter ATP-binding protein [Verrucomicrobiota bacterium]